MVFGSSLFPQQLKNSCQSWTPSDKIFWIKACNRPYLTVSNFLKWPLVYKRLSAHEHSNTRIIFRASLHLIAYFVYNLMLTCTVKPVLSSHSKRKPKLFSKTDYRLIQVKSIAECSPWSILQYFQPSLSYHLPLRPLFCLFLSGRLRQVLLCTFNFRVQGYSQYLVKHTEQEAAHRLGAT